MGFLGVELMEGRRNECTNETSSYETETVITVKILDLVFECADEELRR